MKILVTGAAGFIGSHLCHRLLKQNHNIIGVDNLNDYYDVNLKLARLKNIKEIKTDFPLSEFSFHKISLEDTGSLKNIFETTKPDIVVNLAAQAGVRYSLENPRAYIDTNIVGFMNILENCRHFDIKHLVYASSSSVYGLNKNMPFSVMDNVDHPISLYAASKKSNELMAHTYSHLFKIPTTGLRFFTVYGPWGRPDMAMFLFTDAIINNRPINVFNYGNMLRDFTFVDDITKGVERVIHNIPQPNPDWDGTKSNPLNTPAPYKLYNIGNNNPVKLMDMIETLESALGKKAEKNMMPIQPGDVPETYAQIDDLIRDIDFKPSTSIKHGISEFIKWYKKYYNI